MKISQPFVLLLGGLLSASSLGCSVLSAVVSDYRPASRAGSGSTERMVAIGRVFESQGKYDQAEAMYRRALKQKPADPLVQEKLEQLADRRNSRRFDSGTTSNAVVRADVRSAPSGKQFAVQSETFAASDLGRARLELASVNSGSASGSLDDTNTGSVVTAVASSLPSATVVQSAPASSTVATVTAEEILAVVESPAEHAGLLLKGLMHGNSSETRCLAATLLGDCDPSDDQIRAALESVSKTESDPRLLLAVADSRIQRHEADDSTADCLIELIQQEVGETRTQALLDLRHFVGTESHDECVAVLQSLLKHDEGNVRAIAAMTLEDFTASTGSPAVGQNEITTEVLPKAISRTSPAVSAFGGKPLNMTQPLLPDPK